jgi:hypothetical protein
LVQVELPNLFVRLAFPLGKSINDIFVIEINGINSDVSEITKAPEMLGGRVKTLHPAVHGGK